MDYELTEDGQIQADFARRTGQVLLHYELHTKQLPAEERFEATLCIALLQALLTQAAELIKEKRNGTHSSLKNVSKRSLDVSPPLFGIDPSCIVQEWVSRRDLRYREVIECLRHALSHPLKQIAGKYPVTGYTTWKSNSGVIEGFSFFHSPFVERNANGLSRWLTVKSDDLTGTDKLLKELNRWQTNYEVPGLEICTLPSGLLTIFQDEKPFVPVLQIDISVSNLRTFTLALSDLLSESLEVLNNIKVATKSL